MTCLYGDSLVTVHICEWNKLIESIEYTIFLFNDAGAVGG